MYSIAPDKGIFPDPVLFTIGRDRHVYICLLWYLIVTTRKVPRVFTDVIFVFTLQVKQKKEQQQQA